MVQQGRGVERATRIARNGCLEYVGHFRRDVDEVGLDVLRTLREFPHAERGFADLRRAAGIGPLTYMTRATAAHTHLTPPCITGR